MVAASNTLVTSHCHVIEDKIRHMERPHVYEFQKQVQKKKQTSTKLFCVKMHTAAAKSLQSCPTLCDPIDGSPPGSPVPGILQARTLEWVAISFCNT